MKMSWSAIARFSLILLFAISFPQKPLFSSNQNAYFIHGLANAGIGYLHLDWLAQTTDPFPVFSALVSITMLLFGEYAFYLYQIGIQGIYAYSILAIGSYVFRFDDRGLKYLSYFVLLAALYSGVLSRFMSELPGLWRLASIVAPDGLLIKGVAGQYVLGPFFQPSVFGVFIVLSIYSFLRDKSFIAVVCLAIAATFHSSYLLGAAVLVCTYMAVIIFRDRDYRKALLLGITALVFVMPALIYNYLNFGPTTADMYAQAQNILVDYRIPHHAKITSWFSQSTVFQIIVVTVSIYLARHSRLFPILLGLTLTSIILTVTQVLTGSKALALLFPWRLSVFLVPIASSIILASTVSLAFQISQQPFRKHQFAARAVQLTLLIGSISIAAPFLISIFQSIADQSSFRIEQFAGLIVGLGLLTTGLAFPHWQEVSCALQQTRCVHLLQAAIVGMVIILGYRGINHTMTLFNTPKVGVTASILYVSSTYQPGNLYLIPPDIESFRLAAEIPVFVDFKSHPYKDTELIEWFDRVEASEEFYGSSGDTACSVLQNISDKHGITHVILKSESSIAHCETLHELYRDEAFVIFEVQKHE